MRPSRPRRGSRRGTSGRCWGCRSRSRTRSTWPARSRRSAPTPSASPPADDCEMVRRLREAGAIVVGLTLLPEMAICGFTETATYGVTRNPWNPQHTPGRLQRGLRRGGRGRAGPDRLGRGRRRLDPHPRRLLRPLRPEAAARPGLARARARRLGRARDQRLRQPYGARHGPLARPDHRGVAKSRGAGAARAALCRSERLAPGKLRVAWSTAAAAHRRPAEGRGESSRTRSPTRPSCWARSAMRSRSATPTGAGSATTSPPATSRGIAEDVAKVPHPERLERRTRGFGRLGGVIPDGALEGARARPRGRRRPRQRDLRRLRRADHAGDGRHGGARAALGGKEGALPP